MSTKGMRLVYLSVGFLLVLGAWSTAYLAFYVSGAVRSSEPTYTVYAYFDDVNGLLEGSSVMVAGVSVGQVKSISLDSKTLRAKVSLALQTRYTFSSDTSAAIYSKSLLGGKYVGLSTGFEEERLSDQDSIHNTQSSLNIETLVQQFIGGKK